GHGLYAAALTPKGKVLADLRIFANADGSLLTDTSARAAAGWTTTVRKYFNPRMAAGTDVTMSLADLGVFGAHAAEAVAAATGASSDLVRGLGPYDHHTTVRNGITVQIARVPDVAADGFECFVPGEHAQSLRAALERAGVRPAGPATW